MTKALDCEACDDDHDGQFDVKGLFTVELCGRCARDLRRALFHDASIVEALKTYKHAALLETIGAQALGAHVKDIVNSAKELIIDSQRDIYNIVMAWCADHKKTKEIEP